MKTIINGLKLFAAILLFTAISANAQKSNTNTPTKTNTQKTMKTYVIEREIPGAGELTPAQLKEISQKSCGVLKELGTEIVWLHSYVTDNKLYCVYMAENEELIREHARRGGFPCNKVSEVATIISPATAVQ